MGQFTCKYCESEKHLHPQTHTSNITTYHPFRSEIIPCEL